MAGATAIDGTVWPRRHRAWTPLASALAATGDNWTLMIVLELAHGKTRLSRLQEQLPGVSAGVLERYVHQMDALGLLTRSRFKEMPPRVEVELTDAGRELLPIAGALARWGMRRAWTPPQGREHVDISAILRTLPLLLEESVDLPAGGLHAALEQPGQAPREYRYAIRDGRLGLDERKPGKGTGGPRARICGDREAWVLALGPTADRSALQVSGEQAFATEILAALPQRC